MRIVFAGSGTFGVPVLRALSAGEHELAAVVTHPPRPAGRGGKLRATAIAQAAGEMDLPVWECPDINAPETIARLAGLDAEVLCVVDFSQMVRQPARETVRIDAINLHASMLPALRGAAPVNWAIIRGHERIGVTTFSLVDAMDAGAIYVQTAIDIQPAETAAELRLRLADLGAEAVARTLDMLADGRPPGRAQDPANVTFAPRLKKSDGRIDWSAPAEQICGLICGTWPWPGGQAVLRRAGGKDIPAVIARAAVVEGARGDQPPGELDGELNVTAGRGHVGVLEIKPAGKRLMCWRDFVNGYHPQRGDGFVVVET